MLVCAILLSITGCTKQKETILLKDWLELIVTEMNLPQATSSKPIYLNIDSNNPYFEIVQSASEWGVIEKNVSIDLDSKLTKEWAAYTLVNLMSTEDSITKIKDSNKSIFPDHIAKSVSLGIFSLDKRTCFSPQTVLSKEEAILKLDLVKNYINNYEVKEPIYEASFDDELIDVDVPIEFNKDTKTAIFKESQSIDVDDVIHWKDDDDKYYIVKEINDNELGKEAKLEEADYNDVYNSFEINDSFEVDFSEAEIEVYNNIELNDNSLKTVNVVSRELKIGDFEGVVNADSNGISLKLNKGDLKTEAKIYKVKPTVRWKTTDGNINDAYFKVSFNSTELIKVEPKKQSNYYLDFKNLKGNDFIKSLLNSFKSSENMDGTTIPICQIKVPFPNMPILTLTMQLKLHIYTSGKVELVLVNNHDVGIEIKNNKLRTFSNSERDADFIMKASTATTVGLTTGVSTGNLALMDIFVKGGIRGYIDTVVHLYDSLGNKEEKHIPVELDKADEASINNDDVKVCGNINLHWVLDVGVNSGKTVAAKIGLTKTWNVLNENNGKLILNKKTHIENWQFMEKCTRNSRKTSQTDQILVSDKITLEKINLIVDLSENKKIRIISLPKNIKLSDLVFTTSDSSVCEVNKDGLVTPVKRGSAIITIKTKDNKYNVNCNVLVTNKKK